MNGFDRLKEQIKDQEDRALKRTVDYLLTRKDMEQKYVNEEKTVKGMCKFIREKGLKHYRNGWNYVEDEVVFSWAVMYFMFPNSFLKIKSTEKKDTNQKVVQKNTKNNVISLEERKKKVDEEKKVTQLSLFGGVDDE